MLDQSTKTCPKCGEGKPLDEFYSNGRGGYRADCKPCHRADAVVRMRAYRLADPAAYRASRVQYRAANLEKARDRDRRYTAAHTEANRERAKAWGRANPTRAHQRVKNWVEQNPEQRRRNSSKHRRANLATYAAHRQTRRTRQRAAFVEFVDHPTVFERDGWICGLCGGPVDRGLRAPHPESPSLDHVLPITAGGEHSYQNVQLAHFGCNSRKGARLSI